MEVPEGVLWGSKAASAASNKFREGLLINSEKIMAIGVHTLIESVRESLKHEDVFERLRGISEFWNFLTATETTPEKLRSMPKEFQSVLSSNRMFSVRVSEIPAGLKDVLKEIKEIVHVGELLHKEGAGNKAKFVEKSSAILDSCEERLGGAT